MGALSGQGGCRYRGGGLGAAYLDSVPLRGRSGCCLHGNGGRIPSLTGLDDHRGAGTDAACGGWGDDSDQEAERADFDIDMES